MVTTVTTILSVLAAIVLFAFPAIAFWMIREQVHAPYGRLMKSFARQREKQNAVCYQYRNRHYVRFLVNTRRSKIPIFLCPLNRDRATGIRIVSAFTPHSFRNQPNRNLKKELESAFRKRSESEPPRSRPSMFDPRDNLPWVRVKDNLIEIECWRQRRKPLTIEFINRITTVFCSLYEDTSETAILSDSELKLELIENQISICMVCCEPVDQDTNSIVCDACETPHHVECWDYFGGCSTFGCTEKPDD